MGKITVKNNVKAILDIRNSKFLAFCYFVETKKDALQIIEKHKEEYRDATHNCHGYIIKSHREEGFSDDGEPAKTAGYPILEYLKNNNYEHTLVIVTRYFGGTLLGTGGLVRAYGDSTKEVLEKAGKYLVGDGYLLTFSVDYKDFSNIQNLFKNENILIENTEFTEDVRLSVLVFEKEFIELKEKILKVLQIEDKDFKYEIQKKIVKKGYGKER